MRHATLACPECGTNDIRCLSTEYFLYICEVCGERFSEEDAIVLREKSSQFRTKPRRGYEDE